MKVFSENLKYLDLMTFGGIMKMITKDLNEMQLKFSQVKYYFLKGVLYVRLFCA